MGFFDEITNFFSGGKQKGYEDWIKSLGEGMGQAKDYTQKANDILNPYYQAGIGQTGTLQSIIQRMLNPNQFNKDLMAGYSSSPQAQHQIAIGNDAATNAALASGSAGSTPFLNKINEQSQAIANRDQQQYLQNQLGIFNQGAGMASNMYNTGFGAGSQMSGNLTGLAKILAGMFDKQGEAGEKASEAKTGGLGNFISGVARAFGGGGMV